MMNIFPATFKQLQNSLAFEFEFSGRIWNEIFHHCDQTLQMMMTWHNYQKVTVLSYTGVLQFSSSKRNSRPENSGGRKKKIVVFFTKAILSFPSGFIFRMIWPLHFQELGSLLAGPTFSLIENAVRMLFISEIILQFEHFMIHCTVWILEATTKLRHMEDIVDVRKLWWQFQFISHISTSAENGVRTNIVRS